MKNLIVIILIIFCWQCASPPKSRNKAIFYIYDSSHIFKTREYDRDAIKYLIFGITIPKYRYSDTFLVAEEYKTYELLHYCKYINYSDTSFTKPKSYLNEISYFNSVWLGKEEKLDSFWLPNNISEFFGINDTAKIYLILPKENTDSLILRQVHRRYHQTML